MMKKDQAGRLALVTGASAGIGESLAREHARRGGDLVLVARRKDRLEELKALLEKEYGVSVRTIAIDLSKRESPAQIYEEIDKMGLQVDYLLNNAGFSQQGYFHEIDWDLQQSMIHVNVMAMVELTYLFLPAMVSRNSGRILNVASSAAFAPGGPLQTIYYATKAFIVSFSRGVAGEMAGTGVTVTALCPGATATEFEKVSGLDKTRLFETEKVFYPEEVAYDGYEAMLRGDLVKMTALTRANKFVLKNMNLFPAEKIMQQIRWRQEKLK